MNTSTTWFQFGVQRLKAEPLPYGLIAAWVLSMVTLPIVRWTFGDGAIPLGVSISALLQAAAVLSMLNTAWGAGRMMRMAAVVIAAAWTVEFVGSHTGIPFGLYHYTDRLQPQIGAVPLLIPLAWLMMLPPAWAIADRITGGKRDWTFIAVSALAFTAWDLFLDPQMVQWNFWTWDQPGGYFGIPLVNFVGWLLASALLTRLARPGALPTAPLLTIYGITWALESIGQAAFWGLPGPAVFGFIGMGVCLFAALRVGQDAAQ